MDWVKQEPHQELPHQRLSMAPARTPISAQLCHRCRSAKASRDPRPGGSGTGKLLLRRLLFLGASAEGHRLEDTQAGGWGERPTGSAALERAPKASAGAVPGGAARTPGAEGPARRGRPGQGLVEGWRGWAGKGTGPGLSAREGRSAPLLPSAPAVLTPLQRAGLPPPGPAKGMGGRGSGAVPVASPHPVLLSRSGPALSPRCGA